MSAHSNQPGKPPRIPRAVIYVAVLAVVASWLPLAMILRSRATLSPNPPVHLILDMDHQPKFKTQTVDDSFADHRSMREPVAGTVSREQGPAITDDHYYRGYATDADGKPVMVKPASGGSAAPKFYDTFPEQVKLDMTTLRRGQDRFNIYCSACHGYAGYGDGMVQQRVDQLNQQAQVAGLKADQMPASAWVPPRNLHLANIRTMPVGQIYETITHGMGKMRGYGPQVPVADRWAIVAYVKALQLAQNFPQDDVKLLPPEMQKQLAGR